MHSNHRGIGMIDVGSNHYVVGFLIEMPYKTGACDRFVSLTGSGAEGSK
jgi:hypothetical protein